MKKETYAPRIVKVLTRTEAAEYLRISPRTLDTKLVKTGKIRKFIAGADRTVRFLQVDIDRFINEQLGRKTITGGEANENGNV